MRRLSKSQWKVLRWASDSAWVFGGCHIRTLDALCRLGFLTYLRFWRCKSCGIDACSVHKSGRWFARAKLTPAGVEQLKEAP